MEWTSVTSHSCGRPMEKRPNIPRLGGALPAADTCALTGDIGGPGGSGRRGLKNGTFRTSWAAKGDNGGERRSCSCLSAVLTRLLHLISVVERQSDTPAEALSDHTGSRRRPSDRWRTTRTAPSCVRAGLSYRACSRWRPRPSPALDGGRAPVTRVDRVRSPGTPSSISSSWTGARCCGRSSLLQRGVRGLR
eukprot:scaffold129674_cov66-Phaeocystis_antarctica.AAC.3